MKGKIYEYIRKRNSRPNKADYLGYVSSTFLTNNSSQSLSCLVRIKQTLNLYSIYGISNDVKLVIFIVYFKAAL